MIVVYIASPYTIGDIISNVCRQIDIADELMTLGYCPIVPLLSHFQNIYRPRVYEDWIKIDEELVKRCDVLLRLSGESVGADNEVKLANSLSIPVVYNINELTKLKIKDHVKN